MTAVKHTVDPLQGEMQQLGRAARAAASLEDAQAQAEIELYRGIVAIYKALGGGWQPSA